MEIGKRIRFQAIYEGSADDDYVCLTDVRTLEGNFFRDHAWVKRSKDLDAVPRGRAIEFSARIVQYKSRVMGVYQRKCDGMRLRIFGQKHTKLGLRGICRLEVMQ